MALDFPSNPTDGQVYGSYVYSTSTGVWKAKPSSATVATTSQVPPSTANNGDIWIDTSDGIAYFYYDDGTSTQWVEVMSSGVPSLNVAMPTGSIIQTALPAAPTGWLFCQGQQVLISAYQSLYNAMTVNGTVFSYGANTNGSGGAGTTHFRLPDLQGRVPVGKNGGTFATLGSVGGDETVALQTTHVPSHTHTFSATTSTDGSHTHRVIVEYGASASPSFPPGSSYQQVAGPNAGTRTPVGSGIEAAGSHSHTVTGTTGTGSGSGTAHQNLQPYIVLNHMIKV